MSYLKFDKDQLINLEYSLNREVLRSNRAGSYISTTLSGCNTRKYHGLLICPLEELDGGKHVLLSSLDETVVQHGSEFNLGIHKYEGDHFEPKGHKYIRDYQVEAVPKTTYRVGGVILTKERLLVENEQQILVRYTLEEAHSPTTLRFRPFLAFRNVHTLSKANLYAHTKYKSIDKGIKIRMYDGYPYLHMQISKENEFIPVPDWYNNIEYPKEQNRGYDYQEDLFVPGYFEVPIKKGESIVFSASTNEINPNGIKAKFTREVNNRVSRDTFLDCLNSSAQQLIERKNGSTNIIAGYPWYGPRIRQTLIALPGLTLDFNEYETFEKVINTVLTDLKGGMLPRMHAKYGAEYDCMDSPLWLFWTLQQYANEIKDSAKIWKQYADAMKQILTSYKDGICCGLEMKENGLLSGYKEGIALTWMDSYVDGQPVVQRAGMPVEVNALWYNALCFALEMAAAEGDGDFVKEWEAYPSKIAKSFIHEFWNEDLGYLSDCVNGDHKDWSIRPNMLIAAAMEYSPLDREKQKSILSIAKKELLTPRGLRSLSPRDPSYEGLCEGSVTEREKSIHQGTVWPWLTLFFVEGYLKIHKRGGLPFVKRLMEGFEEEMTEHCIGTISETYNGNPPHVSKGATSQAWSVAAVIRAYKLVMNFEE